MDEKPIGAVWRPVRDLAPEHRGLTHAGAREAAARWLQARKALEDPALDRSSMDVWLREQNRAFAIETGQIEGLYLLRTGVTETLIAEGFENVRGAHSVRNIGDDTLKGLLTDQEAALDMMFDHVKDERPLTSSTIKEWHALLTRHQPTAAGVDPFGNRTEIPLVKGQWKISPNNPHRNDGHVHEYCPPEQVSSEMDRFLQFHEGHAELDLAPETEAAWLHHEFVRIHPFQDGNGRVSRLLMAYAYAKAGEFLPVVPAERKSEYIAALDLADEGDFPALVSYFGDLAAPRSNAASVRAELILRGRTIFRHGNGGVTKRGVYHPPEERQEAQVAGTTRRPEAPDGQPGHSPPDPSDPESERRRPETALRPASAMTERISPNGQAQWSNLQEEIETPLAATDRRQRLDRELQLTCAITERIAPCPDDSEFHRRLPESVQDALAVAGRTEGVSQEAVNALAAKIARARAEADVRVKLTREFSDVPLFEFKARFEGHPRFSRGDLLRPYDAAIKERIAALDRTTPVPNNLERLVARTAVASSGTGNEDTVRKMVQALKCGSVPDAEDIRARQKELLADLAQPWEIETDAETARLAQKVYRCFTLEETQQICNGRGPFLKALTSDADRSQVARNFKALHTAVIAGPAPWAGLHREVAQTLGVRTEGAERSGRFPTAEK